MADTDFDIDIDVDFDSIARVAALLRHAQRNLAPQIGALHAQLGALLAPDTAGGLWLSQTSPALRCQYEQFRTATTQYRLAVAGLTQAFSTLMTNLQSVEGSMAAGVSYSTGP